MSDERDDAKERCGEAEKYGFEAVEAIDTLGGANGGTGGPNYVKWTDAEPFGALTLVHRTAQMRGKSAQRVEERTWIQDATLGG